MRGCCLAWSGFLILATLRGTTTSLEMRQELRHRPRRILRLYADVTDDRTQLLDEADGAKTDCEEIERLITSADIANSDLRYLLKDAGFRGSEIASLVGAWPSLVGAEQDDDSSELLEGIEYLRSTLQLKQGEVRKVARVEGSLAPRGVKQPIWDTGACPAVLATTNGGPASTRKPSARTAMVDTVAMLSYLGLRSKHIREMVVRWPQLLSLEMAQLLAVTDFLISTGLDPDRLGSLYRRAPWLLATSVGSTLKPAAGFLVQECGLKSKGSVETVVRAYPQCLRCSPEELRSRLLVLKEAGVTEKAEIAKVLESFPLILGLNSTTTQAALDFLSLELKIHESDLTKILRAFPSLLGVDVTRMRKSVAFLLEIGVNSVPRIVTRIPPILAYDVDTNLRPKMQFAVKSALSIYDIVRFPAYFSYPLETVIAPREAFLASTTPQLTLASAGLNTVLTLSDDAFARKFADSNAEATEDYAKFKRNFMAENAPPPTPADKEKQMKEARQERRRQRRRSPVPEAAAAAAPRPNPKEAATYDKQQQPPPPPPPSSTNPNPWGLIINK